MPYPKNILKNYTTWRECKALFLSHFEHHHKLHFPWKFLWNSSSLSEDRIFVNFFGFVLPLLATKNYWEHINTYKIILRIVLNYINILLVLLQIWSLGNGHADQPRINYLQKAQPYCHNVEIRSLKHGPLQKKL